MAKQSGLHQIKGKIGEHSYYQQTGVVGGLVRRINQGLSEKVKTAAAFANTRLNNAEFGQAGRIASAIAKYIEPKYRPMILPFSQSKMGKQLLEIIKNDGDNEWGTRNIEDSTGELVAPVLSSVAKNDFSEWGIHFDDPVALDEDIDLIIDEQFVTKLTAIGATNAQVKVIFTNTWIGKFNDSTGKYVNTWARGLNPQTSIITGSGSEAFQVSWPRDASSADPVLDCHMVVVIVLPQRIINGVTYILQEHCTFKAFPQTDVQTLP